MIEIFYKTEFLGGFMKLERPQVISIGVVKLIKQIQIQLRGKIVYIFLKLHQKKEKDLLFYIAKVSQKGQTLSKSC